MFINCPNCSALVATDLATDLPPERCPRCGFGPLVERVELKIPTLAPAAQPKPAPPMAETSPPEPEPEPEPEPAPETPPEPIAPATGAESAPQPPPPEPDPPSPDAGPVPPSAPGHQAPRFLRRREAADPAPGRRLVTVAAGLTLLLVLQLLLADRARLATDSGWRPVVAALCGVLRCTLPPWREPGAIAVEQRDVRPLPERPGVLQVSATLRNDARWSQAWPRLTLTLSDVDGRALGIRAFEPREYLASPPQDVTIGSGESAPITMDIVEPSPHAVAFNFSFD